MESRNPTNCYAFNCQITPEKGVIKEDENSEESLKWIIIVTITKLNQMRNQIGSVPSITTIFLCKELFTKCHGTHYLILPLQKPKTLILSILQIR